MLCKLPNLTDADIDSGAPQGGFMLQTASTIMRLVCMCEFWG